MTAKSSTVVLTLLLITAIGNVASFASLAVPSSTAGSASETPNQISLSTYLERLQALEQLATDCRQNMSPAACASERIGPDAVVKLPSGTRSIRFDWLRTLLDRAAHPGTDPEPVKNPEPARNPESPDIKKDSRLSPPKANPTQPSRQTVIKPQPDSSMPSPEDVIGISSTPNIFKQLDAARKRLEQDQGWAQDAQKVEDVTTGLATEAHVATEVPRPLNPELEHDKLKSILAAHEYHAATAGPTLKDRLLEKAANWINRVIGGLVSAGSKSKWIGQTAEITFILGLCVTLVWLLIRLERQGRLSISSLRPESNSKLASARDWQLWLQDAEQAAQNQAWRDAIHFLYWASISRLESSGVWPADRARTPREYLAFVPKQSPQHPSLAALTESFELTWYANRTAMLADFEKAQQSAAQLGASMNSRRTVSTLQ